MKVFLDCYPCFMRQALECAKLSTDNLHLQKKVLDRTMKILISQNYKATPPHIARDVYREIKEITGNYDPYSEIRCNDNNEMLKVYMNIRSRILKNKDSLYLSCKLAASGNIIDSGIGMGRKKFAVDDIAEILRIKPAINNFLSLKDELKVASTVLYLGDNSGEIVLDKLFIEAIKKEFQDLKIYYGVRGEPVINDVIEADAIKVGMDGLCTLISNGDCSPGTNLLHCSDEFKEIFNSADLIISKGQGNYETLSDIGDKSIYFLLLAKCPVIARHIGCKVGSMILKGGK